MSFSRPAGRRRAPRLAVRLPGRLAGRTAREATVVDLSTSGCLVRCDTLLDPGTILDLEVSLPDGVLKGKVRVADASVDGAAGPAEGGRCLAGMEFIALPSKDGERLRNFVEAERRRRKRADAPAG